MSVQEWLQLLNTVVALLVIMHRLLDTAVTTVRRTPEERQLERLLDHQERQMEQFQRSMSDQTDRLEFYLRNR